MLASLSQHRTDLQSRRIRPAPAAIRAIVMELVEGPTLMDRIARGPIPLSEGLPISKQIAEALEAADDRASRVGTSSLPTSRCARSKAAGGTASSMSPE